MNHLTIASAALAAFMLVGCGDKPADQSKSEGEKKEACCQAAAKTVVPRYAAATEGAALIEPQALIKTALAGYEKIKPSLSPSEVEGNDVGIALWKKIGIEDIAWATLSAVGDDVAAAFYYPRSLAEALKFVSDEAGLKYEAIEVGGKPAYAMDIDGFLTQVDRVVLAANSKEALAEQIKLYTDGASNVAYADLAPGASGILTVKIPSLGKALDKVEELVPVGEADAFLPDASRLLKTCGELVIKVSHEGVLFSVVAGSETDATMIKTALDSVIAMGKMAFEENKADIVETAPASVKEHFPAIEAAVNSLACTQEGAKVTLSVKAKVLDLFAAFVPSAFESAL